MTNITEFTKTSQEIGAVKKSIVDALADLHGTLCELAKLERALEVERQQGVFVKDGLKHNSPDLVEYLEAHARQVQIPTMGIWGNLENSISMIWQINDNTARAELPELFARADRVVDISKG